MYVKIYARQGGEHYMCLRLPKMLGSPAEVAAKVRTQLTHLFSPLTSDCGTQAYRACAASVLTAVPEASSPDAHVSSQVVSELACAVRVWVCSASRHMQAKAATSSGLLWCQMVQLEGPIGAFQPALKPAAQHAQIQAAFQCKY